MATAGRRKPLLPGFRENPTDQRENQRESRGQSVCVVQSLCRVSAESDPEDSRGCRVSESRCRVSAKSCHSAQTLSSVQTVAEYLRVCDLISRGCKVSESLYKVSFTLVNQHCNASCFSFIFTSSESDVGCILKRDAFF